MRPRARLVAPLLPVLLASAQSQPHEPEDHWANFELVDANRIAWPVGLGGTGPFQRALVGNLTGADVPCAVVLKGGRAVLAYQPSLMTGLVELGTSELLDVAVLPGPAGGPDAVIGASATGLRHLSLASGSLVETGVGSAAWSGARRVRVFDLQPAVGALDVLGLDAEGDDVLIATWEEGAVAAERSFRAGGVGIDLEVLDWDDDGGLEIAVLTDIGVNVFELDGTFVENVRLVHPGGAMAALRARSGGRDHLAWSTLSPNGTTPFFYTVNASGYVGPMPLSFPWPGGSTEPIDLVALGSGDWNGDRELDVLISHESFQQAILLENGASAGAPPSFTTGSSGTVVHDLTATPGSSAAGNLAVPAFADVDRDPFRGADLIVPMDHASELLVSVGRPERIDGRSYENGGPAWQYLHPESYYQLDPLTTDAHLYLMLNDVPLYFAETYEFLQVVLWRQDDPITEPTETLQSTAVDNTLYPLSDGPGGEAWPDHYVDVVIPEDGLFWSHRRHYYLVLRFVDAVQEGGSWTVVAGTEVLALGLTLPADPEELTVPIEDSPAYDYLEAHDAGPFIGLLDDAPPPGPPPSGVYYGNAYIGAIVPQILTPPFDLGALPDPTVPQDDHGASVTWQ